MKKKEIPMMARRSLRLERLEERILLSGTAPVFVHDPSDQGFTSEGALTIGIEGYDADGDALTLSAVSSNPNIHTTIPNETEYARLHFVQQDGKVIGDIVVQLFAGRASTAVDRFVTLAQNHVADDGTLDPNGVPFYHDVVVHRVIPGFIIQTGDAENGDGSGGSPLGEFDDAFDPVLSFAGGGVLAMANSGPDTNDCQFFITDGPAAWLDQVHMIFGQMISGQDVVDTIINLPRDSNDRPNTPPLLESVTIFQSQQDGTIIFTAPPNYAGEGDVTISLNDGHGGVAQKVIHVTALGNRPVISDPGALSATPGGTIDFNVSADDDGGLPTTISASVTRSGATATYDNGVVHVTAPTNFSGLLQVTVSAVESAFPDVTKGTRGVFILVESADDPAVTTRIATAGEVLATARLGKALYACEGTAGIEVFDIADPAAPFSVGQINTFSSAREIVPAGRTAFIADSGFGMVSANVGNQPYVQLLANTPYATGAGTSSAISLAMSGRFAFVAEYGGGFSSYDVSDPTQITKMDNVISLGNGKHFSQAVGVALRGKYAYVTDSSGLLAALDVSNPRDMQVTKIVQQSGTPWGMEIEGDRLYVADQSSGLIIYDISDPSNPVKLKTLFLSGGAWQVSVANKIAVVSKANGFSVIDTTNINSPTTVYNFSSDAMIGKAEIDGDDVLVPAGGGGIIGLDLSEWIHCTTIRGAAGTVTDSLGNSASVKIRGGVGYAYTDASGNLQLLKLDETSSSTSVTITSTGDSFVLGDIVIHGNVGSIVGKITDLGGSIFIDGSVKSLTLRDAVEGSSIYIGYGASAKSQAKLVFDRMSNVQLISDMPIGSLTATEWLDPDATADRIYAPSIGQIKIKGDMKGRQIAGDFAADIVTGGRLSTTVGLGKISVAGDLRDATWSFGLNRLGSMTVGGGLDNATINAGSMGTLKAGSIDGSTLNNAGVSSISVNGAVGNLTIDSSGAIGAIRVKGAVENSSISADGRIGRTRVGSLATSTMTAASLRSLNVAGTISGSTVRTSGDIGSIISCGFDSSYFLAGIASSVEEHASAYSEFTGEALIGSVTIKTPSGTDPAALGRLMVNSSFSAARIGPVRLLNTEFDNTENGNESFGFFAKSGAGAWRIRSVSNRDTVTGERNSWPPAQDGVFPRGDFQIQIFTDAT